MPLTLIQLEIFIEVDSSHQRFRYEHNYNMLSSYFASVKLVRFVQQEANSGT